jgi:hypothetical protein
MEKIIKKIIKEEINQKKDKFQKKVLELLTQEGYDGAVSYEKVISFLNTQLGVKGMEAFELYQLLKDNWRDINKEKLVRTDITKRKLRTSNTKGRNLVLNKIPFKGSNTHGEYVKGSYVVFSYDWYPIFVFKDGQWFENEEGYSMSTKKQMSQLRPYGQGDIIETSRDKLWNIINKG